MRRFVIFLIFLCSLFALNSVGAEVVVGKVIKVLPHFLDTNGLHTLRPSLYDRDAYQAYLREHPEQRSGVRFDVQWKTKPPIYGKLRLIVELRGIATGDLPKQFVLEKEERPTRWLSHWSSLVLAGEQYRQFGEITAWRVSLWSDDDLVDEQKSFLWEER